MKYRVVRYLHRGDRDYVVQRKRFGLFWKTERGFSTKENAFAYIESHLKWDEKEVWYSTDELVNEMAKVKEGDK